MNYQTGYPTLTTVCTVYTLYITKSWHLKFLCFTREGNVVLNALKMLKIKHFLCLEIAEIDMAERGGGGLWVERNNSGLKSLSL